MKVLGTSARRKVIGVLVGLAAIALPTSGALAPAAAPAEAAGQAGAGKVAAECVSKEQPLGFGLNGTIKITVCPYHSSFYEVLVMTKDDGGAVLSGVTRVTGSNGTSYTGAWHYDGGQGFNEGIDAAADVPAGTQYCGQFFHQPDRTQPIKTISIPICASL